MRMTKELFWADFVPEPVLRLTNNDYMDPMNKPFSSEEYETALGVAKPTTAPSLGGITHQIINHFSGSIHDFAFSVFNLMFWTSTFPIVPVLPIQNC